MIEKFRVRPKGMMLPEMRTKTPYEAVLVELHENSKVLFDLVQKNTRELLKRPPSPPDSSMDPSGKATLPPHELNYIGGPPCKICSRFYGWEFWHRLVRGHWPVKVDR